MQQFRSRSDNLKSIQNDWKAIEQQFGLLRREEQKLHRIDRKKLIEPTEINAKATKPVVLVRAATTRFVCWAIKVFTTNNLQNDV